MLHPWVYPSIILISGFYSQALQLRYTVSSPAAIAGIGFGSPHFAINS